MAPIIKLMNNYLGGEERDPDVFSEKIWLLEHTVCINEVDSEYFKSELRGNYDYLVADPMWIRMRLFLFWMFWAALIIIGILSIFNYWCLIPSLCSNT